MNKISKKEFKTICKKLVVASLSPKNNEDTEVLISVANNSNPTCRVIFYLKDNKCPFVMQFYDFYSKKRCETLLNWAVKLMQTKEELETIRAKYKKEVYE